MRGELKELGHPTLNTIADRIWTNSTGVSMYNIHHWILDMVRQGGYYPPPVSLANAIIRNSDILNLHDLAQHPSVKEDIRKSHPFYIPVYTQGEAKPMHTIKVEADITLSGVELMVDVSNDATDREIRAAVGEIIEELLSGSSVIEDTGDVTVTRADQLKRDYSVKMTIRLRSTATSEDAIREALESTLDDASICSEDASFEVRHHEIEIEEE